MSAASAAATYLETAERMSPLQAPNQRAIGLAEMADLMRAARESPELSRTQIAGLESGST
ncbi:MAG: hypothetical protein K0R62_3684 [Nonomuraea muscovyensis]|nr:hypothetical protein [Nonomuraea muscovyensis]